jgi:hypothetical protein
MGDFQQVSNSACYSILGWMLGLRICIECFCCLRAERGYVPENSARADQQT